MRKKLEELGFVLFAVSLLVIALMAIGCRNRLSEGIVNLIVSDFY